MKKFVTVIVLLWAVALAVPAAAQFGAVWNGGTPPTCSGSPQLGIDISTGAIYGCGSGTGFINVGASANGTATFTNKTYDTAGTGNSFSINGVAVTANTGTGAVVRATSPTLVTPILGAAQVSSTAHTSANGAQLLYGQISESITLSTSGATTDSSADLLPATALITAVGCRVTTTVTTATAWSVGDGSTAARFCASDSTMTANETCTSSGTAWTTGIASATTGIKQTTAAKLRITTTGTPGAGVIRCTVFYAQTVAPTS